MCVSYEFEDLIAQFDSADVVAPVQTGPQPNLRFQGNRMLERASDGRFSVAEPFRPPGGRSYELTFVHCGDSRDVLFVGSLAQMQSFSTRSVCYISELWTDRFPLPRDIVARLRCFDVIFVGCSSPIDALREATDRPCHYLPPAVDTLRFCPYPDELSRFIDVLSVGRRGEKTHEQLMGEMHRNPAFFYYYDTFRNMGGALVTSYIDHRAQFINLVKRAKYFIANKPKIDQPIKAQGEDEVGYRFFEGAASGTVMIGQPPQNKAFEDLFGWEDSVVRYEYNAPGFVDLCRQLESEPDRVDAIRHRNVVHSLRSHDWAHRWKSILNSVELPPTDALTTRLQRLDELAGIVADGALRHDTAKLAKS